MNSELLRGYSDIYSGSIDSSVGDIIGEAMSPYVNGFSLSEFLSRIAAGEIPLNASAVAREIAYAFLGRIIAASKNMLGVLAVAVLSSFLSGIVSGFEKNGAGKAAYYVCFIAAATLASSTFYDCLQSVTLAIENLVVFMRCIVPVMMTALISSGAIVSATVLEPALLTVIEISVSLIKSLFLPLVMIATGLGIINAMSDSLKTTKLISFINGAVKYGLSVMLTIFVAFAGLRSIAASGADALTLKITKFASSNLIPIVGGILSDSVETVMRCSAVIKNSVGVLGVILIFFIVIMPIVNIISVMVVFRITAAFCEPISDKALVECISCMANGIGAAFSMLVAVSVMFIIMITIMINISV